MRFISPKTDFAFKRIFGSSEHPEILISFLNAMLYDGEPTIQDIEIIDPYSAASVTGLKDTYLDVKAKITGNKTVIVEMQVLNVAAFVRRVGEVAPEIEANIQQLSGEQLDDLGEALLDFTTQEDVIAWLESALA